MGKGRFEFRHIADAVRTSSALRCYVIALELELGLLRWKQACGEGRVRGVPCPGAQPAVDNNEGELAMESATVVA